MRENEVLGAYKQARQHNRVGNTHFQSGCWKSAIQAYSKAITLRPQIPAYWMNRALCYYRRKKWVLVEEDCRRAIHLDSTMVKAHHMLGVALQRRQEYVEGIRELENALILARAIDPNSNVVKRIQNELAKGKYASWKIAYDEKSKKLCNLREACVSALQEKNSQSEGFMDEAARSQQLKALEDVFRKAAEADMPSEVPYYLRCAITLGLLQDPVITPCGQTYEKEAIVQHLDRNNLDPMTRRPLDRSQLVSNLALKDAAQAFLDEHGWAYKELIDDDDL